jgi:hypothetical protein
VSVVVQRAVGVVHLQGLQKILLDCLKIVSQEVASWKIMTW